MSKEVYIGLKSSQCTKDANSCQNEVHLVQTSQLRGAFENEDGPEVPSVQKAGVSNLLVYVILAIGFGIVSVIVGTGLLKIR